MDRPAPPSVSAALLQAFTSTIQGLSPIDAYGLVRDEVQSGSRPLEGWLSDPTSHPKLAKIMTRLGLDPSIIPLWAASEAAHKLLASTPVRPPPFVLDRADDLYEERRVLSTALNDKIKGLHERFLAVVATHDKLRASHILLQEDRSVCLEESRSLRTQLAAAQGANDALIQANETLVKERDDARIAAAAVEEVLRGLEDTSLEASNILAVERARAAEDRGEKEKRAAASDVEVDAERTARKAAEERCSTMEKQMAELRQLLASRPAPSAPSSSAPSSRPTSSELVQPSGVPSRKRSSSPGMPPPPPAKRTLPPVLPDPLSPRFSIGLSGRKVTLPVLSEVDVRFGTGWPAKAADRDLWTAFWASQLFPVELDVESKVCLVCQLDDPERNRPKVFERSTLKVRREAQTKHVEIKHSVLWREITGGRGA